MGFLFNSRHGQAIANINPLGQRNTTTYDSAGQAVALMNQVLDAISFQHGWNEIKRLTGPRQPLPECSTIDPTHLPASAHAGFPWPRRWPSYAGSRWPPHAPDQAWQWQLWSWFWELISFRRPGLDCTGGRPGCFLRAGCGERSPIQKPCTIAWLFRKEPAVRGS